MESDVFASIFGFVVIALSIVVTYQYGIKPVREEKKRRAARALANMRREHWERSRKRPVPVK
jgi:hypothetical protein